MALSIYQISSYILLSILLFSSLYSFAKFKKLLHGNKFIAVYIGVIAIIKSITLIIELNTIDQDLSLFRFYFINVVEVVILSYVYFPVNKRRFMILSSFCTLVILVIAFLRIENGPLISNVCTHIYFLYLAGYNVHKRIFDLEGSTLPWFHYLIISYYTVTLVFSFLVNVYSRVSVWEAHLLFSLVNFLDIIYFGGLALWLYRNKRLYHFWN